VSPIRLLCALIAALALAVPAQAAAETLLPPPGKVFHGGTGGYTAGHIDSFGQRSGRSPAVYQYFFVPPWRTVAQRDLNFTENLLHVAASRGARPMLHLSTARGGHGGSIVTPGQIARGEGDRYLIALNATLARFGRPVYLRVMAEMNNFGNPYSAFGASGRPRTPDHSTRAFRAAWRRIALLVRGGRVADIDARLRAMGLPALDTAVSELPRPRVALMWVPFCAGFPHRPGNGPGAYWPGSSYVDWVGTDFFAVSPNFRCLERFYGDRRWRRKPFVFGEWALWGREDPVFVRRLYRWVAAHRRVRMVVYNQGALLEPLLRLRPRSARELRRHLRSRRYSVPPA
jgi:hypothetical protein